MESVQQIDAKRRRSAESRMRCSPLLPQELPTRTRLLQELKTAVVEEPWLPIGLRTLVAAELPALRAGLASDSLSSSEIEERLDRLCRASRMYDAKVSESRTATLLQRVRNCVGRAARFADVESNFQD